MKKIIPFTKFMQNDFDAYLPDGVDECALPGSKVLKIILFTLIILSSKSRNSIASSKLFAGSFLIIEESLMFSVPGMFGYLAWKSNLEMMSPPYE